MVASFKPPFSSSNNKTCFQSYSNSNSNSNSIMFFSFRHRTENTPFPLLLFLLSISIQTSQVNCKCNKGCKLALGSYKVWQGSNLNLVSKLFSVQTSTLFSWNTHVMPDQDYLLTGARINIPFSCDCINGNFLAHIFSYSISDGDTYDRVSSHYYSNLTSLVWLQRFNSYQENNLPPNGIMNVTVNCSCGDKRVSKDYGLFITWPTGDGEDTLESVASANNLSADVVRKFNPTANFSAGSGLLYIPGKDRSGSYRPLKSAGLSGGAMAGISAAALGLLFFAGSLYLLVFGKRKEDKIFSENRFQQAAPVTSVTDPVSNGVAEGAAPQLSCITVVKSVQFSYEELAKATNDFSLANKIGEGGFGSVYYAELRGEKAAIKKMEMQETREFVAELKVLTNVHHLNLVRLIGYCVEGSLFLVYEYIENGNLSQHLRGSGRIPLSWSTRVQIALDSARGLEYIHEHTVPVYIHRDIKSSNILIDRNFHAKVADFGLTKFAEVGSLSLFTHLAGTFGYMPPEYSRSRVISPKVDVYAFGVVLYELISAKEAIVIEGSVAEPKGLVTLFEEVLGQPYPNDDLHKLVDSRLGDDYPLESVCKMAQLAKACTDANPQQRPSMKSVVVALLTLSSTKD